MVFVRHGGTCIRVHHLRLKKLIAENEDQYDMQSGSENDKDNTQVQKSADDNEPQTEESVIEVQPQVRQLEDTGVTNEVQNELEQNNCETQMNIKHENVNQDKL